MEVSRNVQKNRQVWGDTEAYISVSSSGHYEERKGGEEKRRMNRAGIAAEWGTEKPQTSRESRQRGLS